MPKFVYFGPWGDPEKALEKYRDHLAVGKAAKSTKPGSHDQPALKGRRNRMSSFR